MTVLDLITFCMRSGVDLEDEVTIGKEDIPIDEIEVDYGDTDRWLRIVPRQEAD